MPTKRCCCGNCRLGEDDFNRPDEDPVTGAWHEISGNWEVKDNELTGSGVLATTVCHAPTMLGSFISTMDLIGFTDGADASWEVGLGDPSNPDYIIEVTYDDTEESVTLKVWNGTKTTELASETYFGSGSSNETLKICYAPSLALAVEIDGRIPALELCDDGSSGPCFEDSGIDVGGFSFRDGTFDNWVYDLHWIDLKICERCPCFCQKSNTDFSCYPENLTLSFVSVGDTSATLPSVTLKQSLNTPATPWPVKDTWYSTVQNCGSPVSAKWTAKFSCAQEQMGELSFGDEFHVFTVTNAQFVIDWVTGTPKGLRLADSSSTCDPLVLEFPEIKIKSAFPSPICDVELYPMGASTPLCTDKKTECYEEEPDIRFIPKITV